MVEVQKGFWGMFAITGPLLGLLWTLLFAPVLLVVEVGLPLWFHLLFGLLFGLLAGLLLSYRLQTMTVTIPHIDNECALIQTQLIFDIRGYRLDSQTDTRLVYVPRPRGLFVVKIYVEVGEESLTVTGPAVPVKELKDRIR